VAVRKTLKTNRELDVATADDILNLEFRKLGVKAKLLDNARVLARRKARIVFTLGTGHDHLPRSEDERRCFGVANPHNDSGKTLWMGQKGSTRARDALD